MSMATFEGLDRQLINLRNELRDFYERKILGRRAVPLEWIEHYNTSLVIIENILNALKTESSNPSEIAEQVRRLIEHLNALTVSPAGRGLNINISPLKALLGRSPSQEAVLRKYLTLEFIFERL
jgi:hypothetical protein